MIASIIRTQYDVLPLGVLGHVHLRHIKVKLEHLAALRRCHLPQRHEIHGPVSPDSK